MARVEVEVTYAQDINDAGRLVDATIVICPDCGREASAFGTSEASFKRACVILKEDCPYDNFYYSDEVG